MHWPIWRAKVTERSMEPALLPGDCLLIRRTRRIRPGQVVIARHPDRPEMLLVKRAARRADGGWWLESDNPGAGAVDSRRFGAVPGPLIEGRVLVRYWRARSLLPNGPGIRPRTRERPRRAAGPFWSFCVNSVVGSGRKFLLAALLVDEQQHLVTRQLGAHRPQVDGHAERGHDQDVPPEPDVEGVGRRQRVLVT